MMVRKSDLEHVGGYSTDRERQPPEDYELWLQIAHKYEVANIQETLMVYREIPHRMSRNGISPFLNYLVTICAENIAWASYTSMSELDPVNIAALIHVAFHRIQGMPDFHSMHPTL